MLVRRCCNCDRLMGVRLCRQSGTSHGLCAGCGWHLYGIPDEARPWWRELLAAVVALLAIGPLVVWVVGCSFDHEHKASDGSAYHCIWFWAGYPGGFWCERQPSPRELFESRK